MEALKTFETFDTFETFETFEILETFEAFEIFEILDTSEKDFPNPSVSLQAFTSRSAKRMSHCER